jgi:hypothetical protein
VITNPLPDHDTDLCPGASCQLCQVLVSTLDAILGTDPSEKEVVAVLQYICTVCAA